ncbi:MAG: fatty-acyl-CoA synthase, partial [Blastocatellia bacterium]
MSSADSFNLCDYFLNQSRLTSIGNQTAIAYRGDHLSYGDLRRLVDAWAARLIGRGVRAGDRVALLLYDSPIFIAAFLAGAAIGAVSVPINTALSSDEIEFIVADSGARL